jgi:hypothetical protein
MKERNHKNRTYLCCPSGTSQAFALKLFNRQGDLIMTLKPLHGLFVALALAAAAPSATAADWGAALSRGDLGSPPGSPPPQAKEAVKTVKITASTRYLNVEHFATLRIENAKGQSFVWKFDTWGELGFPLSVIAPKDFAAGETRVYVRHPGAHIVGN